MPVKLQKGSKTTHPMQFCPVIRQINLIRKKWMLPLLLEIFTTQKPIRFSDLQRALQPITPKLLTQRLVDLEEAGVVFKRRLSYNEVEYSLTEKSEPLKSLVALLKRESVKSSNAAKIQCDTCAEKHRCVLAYGV